MGESDDEANKPNTQPAAQDITGANTAGGNTAGGNTTPTANPKAEGKYTISVEVQNHEVYEILLNGQYHLRVAEFFSLPGKDSEHRFYPHIKSLGDHEPKFERHHIPQKDFDLLKASEKSVDAGDHKRQGPNILKDTFIPPAFTQRQYHIGFAPAINKKVEGLLKLLPDSTDEHSILQPIELGQLYDIDANGKGAVYPNAEAWDGVGQDVIRFRNMIDVKPILKAGVAGADVKSMKEVGKFFTFPRGVGILKPEITIDCHNIRVWWETRRHVGDVRIAHQSLPSTVSLKHGPEETIELYYWTNGRFMEYPEGKKGPGETTGKPGPTTNGTQLDDDGHLTSDTEDEDDNDSVDGKDDIVIAPPIITPRATREAVQKKSEDPAPAAIAPAEVAPLVPEMVPDTVQLNGGDSAKPFMNGAPKETPNSLPTRRFKKSRPTAFDQSISAWAN